MPGCTLNIVTLIYDRSDVGNENYFTIRSISSSIICVDKGSKWDHSFVFFCPRILSVCAHFSPQINNEVSGRALGNGSKPV